MKSDVRSLIALAVLATVTTLERTAAYLLGGLQLRGLRRQLVDTKIMTNKQFHDEIMRQGNMPIALIRLAVSREKLTPDMDISWKFYGDLPDR